MKIDNTLMKKIIILIFISVPILSSIISAIHLVNFFNLGNESWMSYTLAIAFELGSVASFLILGILPDIKKWMLWSVFFMLSSMQIIGNIFFSYNFIFLQLKINPNWLQSFNSLMNYFTGGDVLMNMILLSFLIGAPIPIIALFFLKSTSEYFNLNKDKELILPKIEDSKPIEIIPEIIPPTVELNDKISFTKEVEFQPELRDVSYEKEVSFEPELNDVSYQKEIDFSPAFQETPNIEHQEINEIEFVEHDVVDHDIEKPKLEIIPVEYIEDIDDHKKIKPTGPSNVAIYSNNNLQ